MGFKPRIFISSTLSENFELRQEIKKFLEEIGAEVMLYETNLTPSTTPYTYRYDIQNADFIILIIKEKYGSLTNTRLSGTHEEFLISMHKKIPLHVYMKQTENYNKEIINNEVDAFKNDIEKNNIAYYLYRTDEELLSRIKQTVFTIYSDIIESKVSALKLKQDKILELSMNHDYTVAIGYFKLFDTLLNYHNDSEVCNYDFYNSNLLLAGLEYAYLQFSHKEFIFIDRKIQELYSEIMNEYAQFAEIYSYSYEPKGSCIPLSCPIYDEINVAYSQIMIEGKDKETIQEQCRLHIQNIVKNYKEFREYVIQEKAKVDILNFRI